MSSFSPVAEALAGLIYHSPLGENSSFQFSSQDELEELANTLCDKLMKAVDTSTPEVVQPQ